MNRYSTVIAILTAVLVCLGINIGITVKNAEKITHQVTVVCQEHRLLARIASEEAQELIDSNKRFLRPNVNISGLTHQELLESTTSKLVEKQRHVHELETVRKATC